MKNYRKRTKYGQTYYVLNSSPNVRILQSENRYEIQTCKDDAWSTIETQPDRLTCVESAVSWANAYIVSAEDPSIAEEEFKEAAKMYDFNIRDNGICRRIIAENPTIYVESRWHDGEIISEVYKDNLKLSSSPIPHKTTNIDRWIRSMDRMLNRYGQDIVAGTLLSNSASRQHVILCAITSRDLSKNLVRVKSSNVWAYAMNVDKDNHNKGDMLAQFKSKDGGPGDIYIYYDVPTAIYRRWVSAPSKGHYFWQYIRNVFKYSKLTGNKRGVLPNAVN